MKGLATFLMTFRKEKKNPYRIWRNNMSSLEKGNMRLAKHRPFSINCGITTYLKGIIQ